MAIIEAFIFFAVLFASVLAAVAAAGVAFYSIYRGVRFAAERTGEALSSTETPATYTPDNIVPFKRPERPAVTVAERPSRVA